MPTRHASHASALPLHFFKDVSLQLAVEFGRCELTIREMLALKKNSVVQLEREQQEPFEIRVNGRLFARGEIVVINDHYGIRITEIVAPEDWDAALDSPARK